MIPEDHPGVLVCLLMKTGVKAQLGQGPHALWVNPELPSQAWPNSWCWEAPD